MDQSTGPRDAPAVPPWRVPHQVQGKVAGEVVQAQETEAVQVPQHRGSHPSFGVSPPHPERSRSSVGSENFVRVAHPMKITRIPVRYEATAGPGTSQHATLSEAIASALERFDGHSMKVVRIETIEFGIEPDDIDALKPPTP